jgi:hypothetical protein
VDAAFLDPSGRLVVKLGASTLSSGPELSFSVPGGLGLALADVDGDGLIDVVTDGDGGLSVLHGMGTGGVWNGSFSAPLTVPTASTPRRIVLADLDGDGHLDAVVGSYGPQIAIHKGMPGGSFSSAQLVAPGGTDFSVAVGDFNSDGRLDIAVATLDGQLQILLGVGSVGNPSFSLAHTYLPGGEPLEAAVADLNGDGVADIAFSNNPGSVTVCLGHASGGVGDGSFTAPQELRRRRGHALRLRGG